MMVQKQTFALTAFFVAGIYPDIGPNCVLTEDEFKKPFCTVKQSDIRVSYDNNAVIRYLPF